MSHDQNGAVRDLDFLKEHFAYWDADGGIDMGAPYYGESPYTREEEAQFRGASALQHVLAKTKTASPLDLIQAITKASAGLALAEHLGAPQHVTSLLNAPDVRLSNFERARIIIDLYESIGEPPAKQRTFLTVKKYLNAALEAGEQKPEVIGMALYDASTALLPNGQIPTGAVRKSISEIFARASTKKNESVLARNAILAGLENPDGDRKAALRTENAPLVAACLERMPAQGTAVVGSSTYLSLRTAARVFGDNSAGKDLSNGHLTRKDFEELLMGKKPAAIARGTALDVFGQPQPPAFAG